MRASRVFYVARHGETEWNALGRLQGHTDIPLNEVGRGQARALADKLRGAGIVWVASSDLSRARETGEIVAAALGARFAYVDAQLRERGFGIFEGLTREECRAQHGAAWRAYSEDPRNAPPGAETNEELTARAVSAIGRVLELMRDVDGSALIVTHGGTLRALLAAVTGKPSPPIANAALYCLHYDGSRVLDASPG